MESDHKTCSKCGDTWPIEKFSFTDKKRGRRQSYCKFCRKKYRKRYYDNNASEAKRRSAEYRKNNLPLVEENKKSWNKKNPERLIIFRTKSRAKKYNIPFNIDLSDILIPEFCPILGLKLETAARNSKRFTSPSIDRIIPELGYVKGNIRIISQRANTLKSDATLEEMEKIIQDIREIGPMSQSTSIDNDCHRNQKE